MLSKLFINCDGGARGNPGPAAGAYVVKDLEGKLVHRDGQFLGVTTNNMAEYQALYLALQWLAKTYPQTEAVILMDSQLVINQMKKVFKMRLPSMVNINQEINNFIAEHKLTIRNFVFVPRHLNAEADALVNEILDN